MFIKILNSLDPLLYPIRWIFYPSFKGLKNYYLAYFFFLQKILRFNGSAQWPVHFTSRVLNSKKIKVGINSAPGLSGGCYIQGRNGIIIGDNVRIGPGVGLISANHDLNDYDKWTNSKPINIGNDVWIGMNVVVLPGVNIGNNVVIGANSVVSKDIPSNSIALGIPCKVIAIKPAYKNGK
jgi:acetyltransferase-like isoleucine patch superfamily enzyme